MDFEFNYSDEQFEKMYRYIVNNINYCPNEEFDDFDENNECICRQCCYLDQCYRKALEERENRNNFVKYRDYE